MNTQDLTPVTVNKKPEWIIWAVLVIPFLYIAFIWDKLPDTIPTHWDSKGIPNDYSSKAFGTLLLPLMNVALYFLFLLLPKIDPRKKNYGYFGNAYWYIRLSVGVFLMVIFFITIQAALGSQLINSKIIFILVFLLMGVLGNFMRTIRSNFFVGIRTPWTLDNPEVWRRTHERSGKIWFYASLIGLLITVFIHEAYIHWIFIPYILFITVYPIVYSYLLFRKIGNLTPKE